MSFKRNYLSYSALKAFEKSPNHYIEYVSKEKSEPSAAMEFGSATHKWILERSKFDDEYFVAPKIDRRTKEGKELAKELAESGKTHISDGDFLRISTMESVIKRNKWANDLVYVLAESYEQEVNGEIEGVTFKGYCDIIGASYVADLKTAKDADPKSFSRDSESLGYHLQAAIYSRLTGKEFYWVVIQSEAPHNCAVYWQSQEDYEASLEYLLHLIRRFKEWDGMYDPEPYGNEVIPLSLSPWGRIKKYSESL